LGIMTGMGWLSTVYCCWICTLGYAAFELSLDDDKDVFFPSFPVIQKVPFPANKDNGFVTAGFRGNIQPRPPPLR